MTLTTLIEAGKIAGLLMSGSVLGAFIYFKWNIRIKRAEADQAECNVKKTEAEVEHLQLENLQETISVYQQACKFTAEQLDTAKKVIAETTGMVTSLMEDIDKLRIYNRCLYQLIIEIKHDTIQETQEEAQKYKSA